MWVLWLLACQYDPDPRTIRGAFDAAARAIEDNDGKRLFRYIDQRAQHAFGGIVVARQRARALIEADYPPQERARAIAALGDGAHAESAAALFASRCAGPCRADFARRLAAPLEETPVQTPRGEVVDVRTARGTTLKVHLGTHGWYGLVYRTEALMDERDRASRELRQIEDNAAIYRRRRALAASAGQTESAPEQAQSQAQ